MDAFGWTNFADDFGERELARRERSCVPRPHRVHLSTKKAKEGHSFWLENNRCGVQLQVAFSSTAFSSRTCVKGVGAGACDSRGKSRAEHDLERTWIQLVKTSNTINFTRVLSRQPTAHDAKKTSKQNWVERDPRTALLPFLRGQGKETQ